MLQIRPLVSSSCVGSSVRDKSAGVSAWLQHLWGMTDPGAREGREAADCGQHLLALSLSLSHSLALLPYLLPVGNPCTHL